MTGWELQKQKAREIIFSNVDKVIYAKKGETRAGATHNLIFEGLEAGLKYAVFEPYHSIITDVIKPIVIPTHWSSVKPTSHP